MESTKASRGFTLVATLLLLVLLSGIAIGMLMMVNTEGKVGNHDVQNNTTFHAAEGAIEKMTSDLASTFQNIQSPTVSQITGLSALAPANTAAISYPVYSLTPATNPDGTLATSFGQISSGQNQGLYAQILPVALQATAQGPLGDEVNMSRTVEVALVPVFQFGIFSDSDLSFFAGPNLDFQGRVHTNGDLYLAEGSGGTVTFHQKVTAWGNVVRWEMPNGTLNANTAHLGSVDIPTKTQGCDGAAPPACRDMGADNNNPTDESSVTVGAAAATWTTSGQNGNWPGISAGTYNTMIIDGNYGNKGGTGAKQLTLPFVSGTGNAATNPQAYEIVRRPPAGESTTSLLGAARLYNEAQIRVLLVDDPAELPCEAAPCGAGDPQNIRLANISDPDNGVDYSHGVNQTNLAKLGDGGFQTMYFATANSAIPNAPSYWTNTSTTVSTDWEFGPLTPAPVITLHDPSNNPSIAPYLLIDGSANSSAVNNAPQPVNLVQCNPAGTSTNTTGTAPYCPDVNSYPYFSTAAIAPPASDPPLTLPYGYQSGVAGASVVTPSNANQSTWNLLDGYLRVEYKDATGNWNPVTQEWLQLGFARGLTPPTAPGTNPINPNAILIFQQQADRNLDGVLDTAGAKPFATLLSKTCKASSHGTCTLWQYTYQATPGKPPEVTLDSNTATPWFGDSKQAAGQQSPSQFNWYPINFYDAREGEVRDVQTGDASCTPAGVMSAVELDVGNLQQWLAGTTGTNGGKVDYVQQNGYVLYFSDRRGMLTNPNGTQVAAKNTKTGDSGLEDSINTGSQVGTPDGALQAIPGGKTQSPEDVNNNGKLDNFGNANLGLGFGYNLALPVAGGTAFTAGNNINKLVNKPAVPDPYMTTVGTRIASCTTSVRTNWVSGARHALKLVDGSLGNLPVRPDNPKTGKGGFTVGSENPVYIQGDYNSSAADPTWANPAAAEPAHAAAAVIADAVTMLSDSWADLNSLNSPSNDGGRTGNTATYYRVAVAGGKNINFPINVCCAAWAVGDWGTDGGLHNFLRLLENWNTSLNYKGSLVSMYYSTYATGTDKNGGGTVYEPPTRNYVFDPLFTQPQNLPPGTPLFRDIDNLSYRQTFTPCTVNSSTGVCSN